MLVARSQMDMLKATIADYCYNSGWDIGKLLLALPKEIVEQNS